MASQYETTFQQELSRLNSIQRRAVNSIEGPVMVIAGPGTGKTQIIAARIGQILKSDTQTGPHNILCLTYTDAGTVAMRNRLLQFIGPTAYGVNIYTFHAFCNDIIQHNLDYFGKREMEPVSDLENVQILRALLDSLPSDHRLKRLKGDTYFDVPRISDLFRLMKEEYWTPETVSQRIDDYLNDLPNREEFIYQRSNPKYGYKKGDPKQKDINEKKEKMETLRAAAMLFKKYTKMMEERGRYDYSDMILWVLNAFKSDENFLRNYQEWYQYFLVDEYQDTSGAQNELLQCLINYWDKPNVFVVGDDDQCIYEFQGARVKNMTGLFEKYENEMDVIVLKDNYRSTQAILDRAKSVIDHNTQRLINQGPLLRKIPSLTKTLSAVNPEIIQSVIKPVIVKHPNILHEELSIVQEIERLHNENFPLNEVAVIYSKHRQADHIIELLEKKKIPYSVKKKINVLDHPVIIQVLYILKYLDEEHTAPHSGEHRLFEIMHYKFMGINPRNIALISVIIHKKKMRWRGFLADKKLVEETGHESYDSIISFENNLTEWLGEVSNLTLPMLVEKILNRSGLLKFILDSPEKLWLLQVVSTFFDFIKTESAKNPRITIGKFLEMIDQMMEERIGLPLNKIVAEDKGVCLTTAHSAKGLEFRYVFLMGCTTDNWEISRGNTQRFALPDTLTFAQREEENKTESARRLFYVAMTRAKEHLEISFSGKNNEGKDLERSQFIEEISEKTGERPVPKHIPEDGLSVLIADSLREKQPPSVELLDRNFINSLLENYSLSVTHLNKYLQCPVAFYYENILRVPAAKNESMAFGNAVHVALKKLFDEMRASRDQKFPDKNFLLDQFHKAMKDQMESFTALQYKNRMDLGGKILPSFYDKYSQTWNKIVVTEYIIQNVEADGVPLNGKLDKLEFTGRDVNVVDYKTGNPENGIKKLQPPSEREPHGGDYWRQIVFYKILMDNNRRKDWNMVSGEIDFVEKDEKKTNDFVKVKMVISKDEIAFVRNQIKAVYTRIMNHEFSHGCGKTGDVEKDPRKVCAWCEFVKRNLVILPAAEIFD